MNISDFVAERVQKHNFGILDSLEAGIEYISYLIKKPKIEQMEDLFQSALYKHAACNYKGALDDYLEAAEYLADFDKDPAKKLSFRQEIGVSFRFIRDNYQKLLREKIVMVVDHWDNSTAFMNSAEKKQEYVKINTSLDKLKEKSEEYQFLKPAYDKVEGFRHNVQQP